LEDGIWTLSCFAETALRMRVSMSAMGSVIVIERLLYQLDLVTPGTWPSSASFRKQMRHMPKSRMKPRGRPQRRQRLRLRTGYRGVRAALTIIDTLAMCDPQAFPSLTH
jgi:hypothetical protein